MRHRTKKRDRRFQKLPRGLVGYKISENRLKVTSSECAPGTLLRVSRDGYDSFLILRNGGRHHAVGQLRVDATFFEVGHRSITFVKSGAELRDDDAVGLDRSFAAAIFGDRRAVPMGQPE